MALRRLDNLDPSVFSSGNCQDTQRQMEEGHEMVNHEGEQGNQAQDDSETVILCDHLDQESEEGADNKEKGCEQHKDNDAVVPVAKKPATHAKKKPAAACKVMKKPSASKSVAVVGRTGCSK